ncbi:hypothetical protein ACFFG5_10805 [Paraburkholderia humisilvae]
MSVVARFVRDSAALTLGIATGDVPKIARSIGGLVGDTWSAGNDLASALWTPYVDVPGIGDVYSMPAVTLAGDTTCIFYQGSDNTLYMCYETDAPSLTYPAQVVPGSVALYESAGPTAVMFNGSLYVFYGGTEGGGGMQLWYNVYDGTSWSPATMVVNHAVLVSGTMAAPVILTNPTTNQQTLYLVYTSPGVAAGTCDVGYSWSPNGEPDSWTTAINVTPIPGYAEGSSPCALSATIPSPYEGEGPTQAEINIFYGASNWSAAYFQAILGFDSAGTPSITPYLASEWTVPNTGVSCNPFAVLTTPPFTSEVMTYMIHQGWGQCGQIWYNSQPAGMDEWVGDKQVANAMTSPDGSPTAAVFAPDAFFGQMATATDMYICSTNQAGNALLVGSLSQYAADIAPSEVLNVPIGSSIVGNYLIPVSFGDNQTPQPWVFYQVVSPPSGDVSAASAMPPCALFYAVYTENGWVQSIVPTTTTAMAIAPAGSPATAVPATNVPYMVSRTTNDEVAFSYYSHFYNAWSQPLVIPGITSNTGSPSLTMFGDLLYMFYITNGTIYYNTSSNGGLSWSGNTAVPCNSTTGISAVVFNNDLYVFYDANPNSSGMSQLWYTCYSGSPPQWGNPTQVVPTGLNASDCIVTGTPAACVYTTSQGNSVLIVFYAGTGWTDNWQLSGCTLEPSGAWTQFDVPDVSVSASPSTYVASGSDLLNVMYQPASFIGQLYYSVYNGFTWSAQGTTLPVTGMSGSTANVMLQPSGQATPSLFMIYNTSSATVGETSYCECTAPTTVKGLGEVSPYEGMTGAPTAVVFNNAIWVFYQGTSDCGYSAGTLCYQSSPIPPTPTLENPTPSWTPSWTAVAAVPSTNLTMGTSGESNPAAVVFGSSVYVFYFTNDTHCWLTCSVLAENSNTWSTSNVEVDGATICGSPCVGGAPSANMSPSAVVWNGAIYVFYTVEGGLKEIRYLNCVTSTDGSTWTSCQPSFVTTSTGAVPALVYNNVIYLFYQGVATSGAQSGNATSDYYYTPFSLTGSAQPTQIGLLTMSSGPSIVAFNGQLWCLTQGGSVGNAILPMMQTVDDCKVVSSGDQQVWYATTPDNTVWSWNTAFGDAAIDASTIPAAVVFPPESVGIGASDTTSTTPGSSAGASASNLYVFFQNNGQISYKSTPGGYANWTAAQAITPSGSTAGSAIASCSPAAVSFPVSDAASLWLFFQDANSAGQLWYTTFTGASGWSPLSQVVPTGCTASTAIMSQSPSAVIYPLPEYATASSPSQLYVFYGGPSGSITGADEADLIPLYYSVCSASDGTWTQNQIPVSYSWSGDAELGVSAQTLYGFDSSTSPNAVVFNNTLYVFYTALYGPVQLSGTEEGNIDTFFAYSTFNGTSWSKINFPAIVPYSEGTGGTATVVAYFICACAINGILYAFFQNSLEPSAMWYTQTSDGSTWSMAAPVIESQLVSSGTGVQYSQDAVKVYSGSTMVFNYLGIPVTVAAG